MALLPARGKRSAPGVDIPRPEPHEIGRARKEAVHVLVAEAQLAVDPVPYGVLSGHGQRHVDAVQRHIVDLELPALPIPPGGRIIERAVVEIVPVLVRGHLPNLLRDGRHGIRKIHVRGIPAVVAVGVMLQIMVQGAGNGDAVVAPQHNLIALLLQFENVFPILLGNIFDLEQVGMRGNDPLDQRSCGLFVQGPFPGRGTGAHKQRQQNPHEGASAYSTLFHVHDC